jgi:hypothetical protein
MIVRDLALAWVQAHCFSSDVRKVFLEDLDRALARSVGCSFILGRELTQCGRPYLVYCFCGELFTFPLTPRQAARLKVGDATLISAGGAAEQHHDPRPEPLVRLEGVEVDGAESLDRETPIKGTLRYRTDHWWDLPLAIQMVCESGGRTTMALYHHLVSLPRGAGTVHFSLSPVDGLRDHEGQPFAGILPFFFQLCIVGEPEKVRPAGPMGGPSGHGPGWPTGAQTPIPAPPIKRKLGERFVAPSPTPTLMSPATMAAATSPNPWAPVPRAAADRSRFRSISDIRAVLVELDE